MQFPAGSRAERARAVLAGAMLLVKWRRM